jgi:phosphonate transport system substrate-binding protein
MFPIPRVLGLSALALLAVMPAAGAAWRDDITALRVGVIGGDDAAYRITTLEPFRVYLQDKTGIPVEIVPTATYDLLIDAQAAGEIDYAIYSATAYATAAVKCDCVEALAAPLSADGALGFYSVLVARAGDPIDGLATATGKRLALGPADSVSASIVPRHAFAADGIDPATYFMSVTEYASPEDAMAALVHGEVDLATAWSSLTGREASGYSFGTFTDMVSDGELAMDRIRVVWQSPLIPFGPHAIRASLPGELKRILSGALLAMSGEDPEALDAVDRAGFGGGGFASPDQSLYASVIALVTPGGAP